jgi:hypothetical protein
MRLQLDTSTSSLGDSSRVASPSAPSSSAASASLVREKGTDSIGISGPSAALGRLAADRASRIQQLTATVRAGTYSVPGSAIGSAIIAQSIV